MNFLIGIGLIILLGLFIGIYILFLIIADKIKIIFGYKKYEYSKILSYGIRNEFMWHKTDEKALAYYKNFEFVSIVKPYYKKIRPL